MYLLENVKVTIYIYTLLPFLKFIFKNRSVNYSLPYTLRRKMSAIEMLREKNKSNMCGAIRVWMGSIISVLMFFPIILFSINPIHILFICINMISG